MPYPPRRLRSVSLANALLFTACLIAACGTDSTADVNGSCGPDASDACSGDGDMQGASGDGDGDATTGDGDGDGDGDAQPGDGDGDGAPGDGDGDAQPGDGDGDGDTGAQPPPGCRAPDEPSCAECCSPAQGGGCTIMSSGGGDPPWYNSSAFTDAACPGGCEPCSTCSDRDEAQLLQLGDRPECDCSGPPGIDECFSPGSCGCFCSRVGDLRDRCPHLAP